MVYHAGDELTPGYEVLAPAPSGPLSERYVVRDAQEVFYEVELLPKEVESPAMNRAAGQSLGFIAGLDHPCLPESHGSIAFSTARLERHGPYRELPLWEHAAGKLSLFQLVESAGALHPAQAVEILLGVCDALIAVDSASRNSTGDPFPHLALSPVNVALRENRVPVVLGWANRAAFITRDRAHLQQNRHISFLDPIRPRDEVPDRRHDVYALAACLFFMIKGFPPPFKAPREPGAAHPFIQELAGVLGLDVARLLARALSPRIEQRPSVEALARGLKGVHGELEAYQEGCWSVCAGCGLMLRNDPDLCPLCIRDRILPATHVPPPAFAFSEIPPALALPPYGDASSLEELRPFLSRAVFDRAAGSGDLEQFLRRSLHALAARGLREFMGDLLREDGSLTDDAGWVAAELAHRIHPQAADEVEIACEKGMFLRWLRNRERSARYRKTLRVDARVAGERVDIVFRGRLYLLTASLSMNVWHKLARLARRTSGAICVVALRGDPATVPPSLSHRVCVYAGRHAVRSGPGRLWGALDEYRLFSLVRGARQERRTS